jgi:hypothetical protein
MKKASFTYKLKEEKMDFKIDLPKTDKVLSGLFFLALNSVIFPLFAQDTLTSSYSLEPNQVMIEGILTYEVETSFSKKNYNHGLTFRKKFRLSFNEDYIRGDQIGDEPNYFFLFDRKTKTRRVFTNFFGTKLEIIEPNSLEAHPQTTIAENETKQILGQNCNKLQMAQNNEIYELWVAPNIKLEFPRYLNQCALNMKIPTKYGERIYKIISIENIKPMASFFEIDGYKPIYLSDFVAKFGKKPATQF